MVRGGGGMKRYKYFMSYQFSGNSASGMGSIGIELDEEIKNMETLERCKRHIEKALKNKKSIQASVIILNFQLLSIQEANDGNEGNS